MTEKARIVTKLAVRSLDKHLANDIRVIDIADITSIGDSFVIAHGNSTTQVKALADHLEKELKEKGIEPLRVEGYSSTSWILIDYGEVIVHVFYGEMRNFYDLERLWKDGEEIPVEQFLNGEETAKDETV